MSGADSLVPGARHVVVPAGIAATSWPRVASTCRNIGWRFDPWQAAVGRLILAKKVGGGWAADLSILSIPRQVGKSYLFGCIIFALCLLNPKLRVIWTSHHTATTEEMYEAMKELAEHKRVKPHVVKCIALQGSRWRIQFRNGSRIDFGARSQGFGRGKARVGVLVLDEFQHITSRALANLGPTTNTADNPLILCAGTPPGPEVQGEAFSQRRKAAIDGLSDDTLYVEFSADAVAEPDDRKQWAKANPSFPKRTAERAFLLQRKLLAEDDFLRDMLGIWDDDGRDLVIPLADWSALGDSSSDPAPHVGPVVLGVDSDPARKFTTIVACGARAVGPPLIEVTSDPDRIADNRAGVDWALARIVTICARNEVSAIVIDKASAAASLVKALEEAKIPVVGADTVQMRAACGQLYDAAVETRELVHLDDPLLVTALKGAAKRDLVGAWAWDKRNTTADITPLVAATLALWGHSTGVGVVKNAGKGRAISLG